MFNDIDVRKRIGPVAWRMAILFLFTLIAIAILGWPTYGADLSDSCAPVTLKGSAGFTRETRYGTIKVTWMTEPRRADGRTFVERELEFSIEEVFPPYWLGDKRRGLREITFIERGCRPDGEPYEKLLAPLEFKRHDGS